MAYIGQSPFQEFTSVPTKDSFTGDGSTTTFDLANDVVRGAENALEVFVNNVRQEPGSGKAFTLGVDGSNNYRRITFTAAPASSAAIYVINDKTNLTAIAPLNTDFNGAELVLDADADTTLHADTDDEIDVRVAGNDIITIKQSSGDGILQIPVDAKDLIFQQADGNKLFEINDGNFVGVGGNATAPGEIRIFEDTDNGTNYSGFKAAANTTASVAYQLPAADGTSGFQLTTDGSGVLSWASAGTTLANDANNRVVTGTGSGLNGEANLTFDGSTLAVTGAITGSSDLTLQDDLILDSDAAVLSFGDDQEVTLTHVADTGLTLNSTNKLMFNDASQFIQGASATVLDIAATDEIELTATLIEVVGNATVSGTLGVTGIGTFTDDIIIGDGKTIGSASDVDAIAIGSDGDVTLTQDLELQHDGAILSFGANDEVSLTHVHDTGILLNSTNVIQFNDASQNIGAPSATVLDINATDEIELNATLVDINANVEISGTAVTTGVHTFTAVPVFPDNTVESADIQADAITGAKIADDAINSEHYTDGSIDTAHIGDNQITLAKMAGGTDGNLITYDASGDPAYVATGSDGQVLTSAGADAAPTFEALPTSGKVLQVVSTIVTAAVSGTAAQGGVTAAMISLAITPTASNSKILVMYSVTCGPSYDNFATQTSLFRGGTQILQAAAAGSRQRVTTSNVNGNNNKNLLSNSYTGLDAPATTSAITYDVRLSSSNDGGTATLYLNRSSVDSDIDRVARGSSSITLMEIGV